MCCVQGVISESESTGLHVSMCVFVCQLRVITNNVKMSNVKPIHDQRKCKAANLSVENKTSQTATNKSNTA